MDVVTKCQILGLEVMYTLWSDGFAARNGGGRGGGGGGGGVRDKEISCKSKANQRHR